MVDEAAWQQSRWGEKRPEDPPWASGEGWETEGAGEVGGEPGP